ncbi:hypothetical protein HBI64_199820 [Parastagonospora nodorum]|nr:hypothetical protein HBI74_217170 [Parastagonospora nodorum]KAH5349763.1 hypothetical protein HBI33_219190 [Parastagonospora nodorum]KAH5467650.1 hypothetical protein HBI28_196320 [Parastagonospora nodorum]KAH5620096.1 hypothetical protein HBI22_213140 [Parastagonospora nodorum]KAH6115228.1 hypothetical protein HBI64_199820 [Parastagonospora nodorum]
MYIFEMQVPPELVAIVLHHLVCSGLRNAWLARGTCSTFRTVIEHDIVTYQTNDVLRQSEKIMAHMMPRYLAQRSKRLLDVDSALPTRINNMMGYLCSELHIVTIDHKEAYRRELCKGLVNIMGHYRVANILWDRMSGLFGGFRSMALTTGVEQNTLRQDRLMAAMVARQDHLVYAQVPQNVDVSFELGWEPLVLAVRTKDYKLLQAILEALALAGDCPSAAWANFSAVEAAGIALDKRNIAHALAIIDGIRYSGIALTETTCNRWLEVAMEIGVPCLMQATLRVRSPTHAKIKPKLFEATCKAKKYKVAVLLLDRMDLSVGGPNTLPLHVAVRAQNPDLITAVLNAGADVNQRVYQTGGPKMQKDRKYTCPVEVAMRCGTPGLKLLLERGATIPPLRRWFKERRAYNLLRDESFVREEKKRFPPYPDFQRMTVIEADSY